MTDPFSFFLGIGCGLILGAAGTFWFFVIFQGNDPSE